MNGAEARRRLGAVGFKVVRIAKHTIMERPASAPGGQPMRIIVSSGSMSRRAEAGVLRILEGRPTALERQAHRNVGEVIDG